MPTAAGNPQFSGLIENETMIRNPRVVCVSSSQFNALGFANQIDMVLNAFPQKLKHTRITTSHELRELLTTERVDVVHITAFVCPRSVDLYFSDIDMTTGRGIDSDSDILPADALAVC